MKNIIVLILLSFILSATSNAQIHHHKDRESSVPQKSTKKNGTIQRAVLGIQYTELTAEDAKEKQITVTTEGLYLAKVTDRGAAKEAGLQEGDVIVKLNGSPIKDKDEIQEVMNKLRPGDNAEVVYYRNNKLKRTTVTFKNDEDSSAEVESAAEKGDPSAMIRLGDKFYEGLNVDKDYSKAMEWYQKAADKGYNPGLHKIGEMYYYGHGVHQDHKKAFEFFKKASEATENPSGDAMKRLSDCYRFGFGTTKNLGKAEFWLKKAQEAGNDKANAIKQLMDM